MSMIRSSVTFNDVTNQRRTGEVLDVVIVPQQFNSSTPPVSVTSYLVRCGDDSIHIVPPRNILRVVDYDHKIRIND